MSKWDERYAGGGYLFGTEPNGFLASQAHHIPLGPVLCIAEGEGRNAAWLAGRGHQVTAMDASAVGMKKARRLATAKGVNITTEVTDLDGFDFGRECWCGIVLTFGHLLPELRREVSRGIVRGLKPDRWKGRLLWDLIYFFYGRPWPHILFYSYKVSHKFF